MKRTVDHHWLSVVDLKCFAKAQVLQERKEQEVREEEEQKARHEHNTSTFFFARATLFLIRFEIV